MSSEHTQRFFDIGTNLTDKAFEADREQVIQNAIAQGVDKMLVLGTDLDESAQALALCQQNLNHLYATIGCHPHYAKKHTPQDILQLSRILDEHDNLVAIGECGLDFNRNFSTPEQQIRIFEAHLSLASQSTLPLYLHERDAFKTLYDMLLSIKSDLQPSVLHCFTGNKEALRAYLDLGLFIGITGWVCDERRGQELQTLLQYIPADRLLAETDAPYLLPRTIKPKPKSRRNEPRYIRYVIDTISQCTGRSFDECAIQTYNNAMQLFQINQKE